MNIRVGGNARIVMVDKLKEIFKDHIGMSNAISSELLYYKVVGKYPDAVDYYEREYKWNLIKRILGSLRKSGELFVIMGSSYHYVLNDDDELNAYKNKTDATIKGLKKMKQKAEAWVKSKELEELKKKKESKKKKKVIAMTQ